MMRLSVITNQLRTLVSVSGDTRLCLASQVILTLWDASVLRKMTLPGTSSSLSLRVCLKIFQAIVMTHGATL